MIGLQYPSWLIVLKAIIRFKSFCNRPVEAAKNEVRAPTHRITKRAVGEYSKIGEDLNSKYTPAVTSVAAWSKAETGVGKIYY